MLLVSCATVEDRQDAEPGAGVSSREKAEPENWAKEASQRQAIDRWEIRGRLGVQTETNGGSMDIIWKQAGDEYSIHLIAAMGSGNYLIQGNNRFAEIRFPDGSKKTIDDIDGVFSTALELDLPVSAVRDWVRGLPAASLAPADIQWNRQGLIGSLDQSGWHVEMKKYAGAKRLLPHDLRLTHRDDDEVSIRFLFRQWLIDN